MTQDNNGKGIVKFGERDDIREMADRLTKMMPGTSKFTQTEALTVAQVAIAHGLDPFTGEVWGLKSNSGEWYGCMIGIAGRRKKSREQMTDEGGVYWTEPPKRVEPAQYNQPETAVVYEIHLRDTITMQAYSQALHSLTSSGIPYKDAIEMIGRAPVWIGIGIAHPAEKSKMDLHARAKKRAEADALKQRFDIHLAGINYSEGEPLPDDAIYPDFIDGKISDMEPQPEKLDSGKTEDQLMAELGFTQPVQEQKKEISQGMKDRYRALCQKALDLGLIDSFQSPTDYDAMVASASDIKAMIVEYETALMNGLTEEG